MPYIHTIYYDKISIQEIPNFNNGSFIKIFSVDVKTK